MNIVDLNNNEKNIRFGPEQDEKTALLLSIESLGFKRAGTKFRAGHPVAGILVIDEPITFDFCDVVVKLGKKGWDQSIPKDQRMQYLKIGYVLFSCYKAWGHAQVTMRDV